MDHLALKEEWKFATTTMLGAPSVITLGLLMRLMWSADNLGSVVLVSC